MADLSLDQLVLGGFARHLPGVAWKLELVDLKEFQIMRKLNEAYELTKKSPDKEHLDEFQYTINVVSPHIEVYEGPLKDYFSKYLEKIREKHKHSLGYGSKVI